MCEAYASPDGKGDEISTTFCLSTALDHPRQADVVGLAELTNETLPLERNECDSLADVEPIFVEYSLCMRCTQNDDRAVVVEHPTMTNRGSLLAATLCEGINIIEHRSQPTLSRTVEACDKTRECSILDFAM